MAPQSTTISPAVQPWDQQPGEPPACYARFLIYRNLGMGRTLDAAYLAYCRQLGRTGGRRKPGNWRDASVKWEWRRRAAAWDIKALVDAGEAAARAMAAGPGFRR